MQEDRFELGGPMSGGGDAPRSIKKDEPKPEREPGKEKGEPDGGKKDQPDGDKGFPGGAGGD